MTVSGLFRIGILLIPLALAADNDCLQKCLQSAGIPSFFQDQAQFANLSSPYNVRLPFTPAAVVTAEKAEDVSEAVKCASSCGGFKVQARSGGNSYASHSLGGQNGSIVIDLSSMNQVTVNKDTSAEIGGGVRLGNLDKALFDQGKRAMSHGTCANVGFGGHSLHGGYGYESRLWGLSLDHIQSLEVVLANGTVAEASPTKNEDLFWAVRGAGESFGVVTKFNIRTEAAPDSLVYWTFNLSDILKDISTSVAALEHVQDFALNKTVQDRRLTWGWYLDDKTFLLRGKFHGPMDEFNQRIAPEMLRGLPDPTGDARDVREVGWLQSQALYNHGSDNISELVQPSQPGEYSEHENFYAMSLTSPDPLTKEAITAYLKYAVNQGAKVKSPSSWYSIVNLYGGPDSQIDVYNSSWSAYGNRDSLWVFQNHATVDLGEPFDNSLPDFISGLNKAVTKSMPMTSFGAYTNYIDPGLSAKDAHRLYYGELYPRLLDVKKRVDPDQTFSNPLAIGVGDFNKTTERM
ncbi:glucooligosaccharide oxidase [Ophiocordyceps camponoti-floridani]|uniref:Glucooligosaccharide oxidase n=1 Tax=Ophiocordyceps camponoti-floridani TaxID=2030778 RepID=A0A8H4QDC0_9HYPO|nr:glucooligosaccharide oxidase [Ophiocordyceps camponoti-floridani]